jgi:pilus assembly protein CpaF
VTADQMQIRARVQDRLLAEEPHVLETPSRWERRVRVREAVARFLADERIAVPGPELATLVRELSDEIVGLGPLEPLLRDPSVTEVMVNGPRAVYVERDGKIEPTEVVLDDDAAALHLIDRIVAPLGLRIDESSPWVDARLPDGSRVHAIVPPLAVGGPAITIRRFSKTPPSLDDLARRGGVNDVQAALLIEAVRARKNILVSGGAGAGKTTLLGALAGYIPERERVVTIEDAAELRLQRAHVVALETRPANVEGAGRVTVRDLVRNALRMRPDRIIVGEVRGGEALDMLQAMNTGHDGSMSTAHSNSPLDMLTRLEAMAAMGDARLPVDAVRRQIGAALDVIVHVARASNGGRRVTDVCSVRAEGATLVLDPLV